METPRSGRATDSDLVSQMKRLRHKDIEGVPTYRHLEQGRFGKVFETGKNKHVPELVEV